MTNSYFPVNKIPRKTLLTSSVSTVKALHVFVNTCKTCDSGLKEVFLTNVLMYRHVQTVL